MVTLGESSGNQQDQFSSHVGFLKHWCCCLAVWKSSLTCIACQFSYVASQNGNGEAKACWFFACCDVKASKFVALSFSFVASQCL